MSHSSPTDTALVDLDALWSERGLVQPRSLDDAACDVIALALAGYESVWTVETVAAVSDHSPVHCLAGRWRPRRALAQWFAAMVCPGDFPAEQHQADLVRLLAHLDAQFQLLNGQGNALDERLA
ncbi:MAG: hypothetical protein K1X74_05020 [Pirellulales bacterium]|nr:hypothetical protein [Pirellulales bacterium]